MRFSFNFRQGHEARTPLEDLPVTVTRRAGRFHAGFICVFALIWGGFPPVALFAVGGEIDWSMIWIVVLFPLIAVGLFLFGLRQWRWYKTVTMAEDRVGVVEGGLFSTSTWEEPLSAYEGVVARSKRVSRSSRSGSSSYTVYLVDLYHADDDRTITLFSSTSERDWRSSWEDAARKLGLKALEESGDGLIERDPEDLDKSVADLMEEGKVAVDYDLLQEKAEGIAVDIEGETMVVTRAGPQNGPLGSLIFLLFPWIFIWVGFYSDAPGVVGWIFGAFGILFEVLIVLLVAWDFLSRQRIRIGRDFVRVCDVSRWGETKGKSLPVEEIEVVKLGGEAKKKSKPGLNILGDCGKLRFGRGLPEETLHFIRNLVLAKIEKHHVPGRASPQPG